MRNSDVPFNYPTVIIITDLSAEQVVTTLLRRATKRNYRQ